MAPLLYLSVFLVTLTAACLAEIVSLRASSSSRIQELVKRPPAEPHHVLPPIADNTNPDLSNDLELLDIVLVASVDGKFHALSRSSGQPLWSMSSYAPSTTSFPSTLGPLVRTNHIDIDPELADDVAHQELYIVEPQSGDIYVMETPSSPLQCFPFSMSELVDMSPFSFVRDKDRRVFVGRKETSLLLVELETGKVKATFNSECPWDPFEDLHEDRDFEMDSDELEGSKPRMSSPTEVFIGRTDYHISIHTRMLNGNSASTNLPVQNISFSTYGPNNQDHVLQSTYKRTPDDAYIQSLPNGEIISFKAKVRGDSVTSDRDSQPIWAQPFNKPIVAIFDVLRNSPSAHPHSRHTFVLLQPRPRLQDIIPNLSLDTTAASHSSLHSAYVGMVEETGSLFAMSPGRFPLVVFGDVEPPSLDLKYIDAPGIAEEGEQYNEVDAVTRARKQKEWARERETRAREIWYRERCKDGLVGDRKCLVGMRRLEGGNGDGPESRLKRLLDGVPSDALPVLPSDSQKLEGMVNETGVPRSTETRNLLLRSRAGKDKIFEALVVAGVFIFSLWLAVRMMKTVKRVRLVEGEDKDNASRSEHILGTDTHSLPEKVPPVLLTPSVPADVQPKAIGSNPQDTVEDSDREGDGDGEGDVVAISTKRKVRRGKRGKKKKVGIGLPSEDREDEENVNAHVMELGTKDPRPSPPLSPADTSIPAPAVEPSLVVSDAIIGFGSHGTVVFQGSFQGRAVAVKRLLQDFVTLASREVSILQESDDHPNVIRYYYQEAHANFLYIALELCPASLADIIESPDREQWRDIAIAFDPKVALRQITSGLRHLHALKLVHRDIKPQNILVSSAKAGRGENGKVGSHRMLISDFGLCKKLDVDQTSFLPTAHGSLAAGTIGWRAPEILRGEVQLDELGDDNSLSSRGSVGTPPVGNGTGNPTRLTRSVDVFALGCLFFYTLTNGGHPFGDRFEREVNILKNTRCLEGLERFGEEGAEAADLISNMLHPEAHERPDTTTCLLHPFFWDPGRRLNFLQDASDRFEIMCRDPKDSKLLSLEQDAINIVGNDWHSRLDKVFIDNLGKFRKYDGRSVQDLLRALRNKKNHYQDLPDNVKRHLGPMPEGFLSYFTRRYPQLFLHVHSVVVGTGLCDEPMFRSYFEVAD